MVYSLLSMLGSCNKEDMSRTLLEMSNNQDSCIAMRQSGKYKVKEEFNNLKKELWKIAYNKMITNFFPSFFKDQKILIPHSKYVLEDFQIYFSLYRNNQIW